jgi:hypothetical protein
VASIGALISVISAIASSAVALTGQRRQYFSELRKWADEACETLSEAVHMCDLDPTKMGSEFFERKHDLRCRLSSQIDRGRWFYPNIKRQFHGTEKAGAFQGYRQPILDHLTSAYRIVGRFDYAKQAPNLAVREDLVELKRLFVSEIHDHLDPAKRRQLLRNLMEFKR